MVLFFEVASRMPSTTTSLLAATGVLDSTSWLARTFITALIVHSVFTSVDLRRECVLKEKLSFLQGKKFIIPRLE